MNWYQTENTQKNVRQIVVEIPPGNEKDSQFGMLLLSAKYMDLMTVPWTAGFFRLDAYPGPHLLVRGDNVAAKLRGSPIRVAFSFYRMKPGGLFTAFVDVDCPSVREKLTYPHVLFEACYGLDMDETTSLLHEAIARDTLHLCFAEGKGTGEMSAGVFSAPAINAQFDVIVPVPEEWRAALKREWESLLDYHRSVPANLRDFEQSALQLQGENPQTENPIAPPPSHISGISGRGSIHGEQFDAASENGQQAAVASDKPAEPAKEGRIFEQHLKLLDEMLALPVPPENSGYEYSEAMVCNYLAYLMSLQPCAKFEAEVQDYLQGVKTRSPDWGRVQILATMHENYVIALRDPLNFHTLNDNNFGQMGQNLLAWISRVIAVLHGVSAVHFMRITGENIRAQRVDTSIRTECYLEYTSAVQAGLLMACFCHRPDNPVLGFNFYDAKPIALAYLMEWFGECDVKGAHTMLEAYFAEARKRCEGTNEANVKSVAELTQLFACWKTIEESTLQELLMQVRRNSGSCLLCGKKMGAIARMFGQRSHGECIEFVL